MPIVTRPRMHAATATIAARYRRVSTHDQLNGFGLEDQDRILNGWQERNPHVAVYGDYVDEGVSGALESRPEMDRLCQDANKPNTFNRILVPKVDRIGRTARAAYMWAWNMQDLGIHFISVSEGIDTSQPGGWEMFNRYVEFAEMEWNRIKERTFNGKEMAIHYGAWPGGVAPYGYKIIQDVIVIGGRRKKISRLATEEKEAVVLSTAAAFIADQGMNFTEACDTLNERGLLTRSGLPWTPGNLRNRLYAETIHEGFVTYRKTNRGSGKRTTKVYEDGEPVLGPQMKIGVPAILTLEQATALMAALKKIGFQNNRKGNTIYPLSARITASCGEPYTGGPHAGGRAYRCKGKRNTCGDPYFRADEIENAVWAELSKLLADEERLRVMAAEWIDSLPGDKQKYEERVAEYTQKIQVQSDILENKIPEYVRAGVDPQVLRASIDQIKTEINKATEERAHAQAWLEEYAETERRANSLTALASNAVQRLAEMDLEGKRELFAMFNVKIQSGKMDWVRKSGTDCPVSSWHWDTGTLVPPNPTDSEWENVLNTLRPFFPGKTARTFTSKYDIRQQFEGMLYRLREGISWVDMPLTWGAPGPMRERQLLWWKKGAWPEIMTALGASERGVPAYRRPTLPTLTVTGQLRGGLFSQTASQGPKEDQEAEICSSSDAILPSGGGTGFETPIMAGAGFMLIIK